MKRIRLGIKKEKEVPKGFEIKYLQPGHTSVEPDGLDTYSAY